MDWQKILNLFAIGVVAWLLLIQWDRFDGGEAQVAGASVDFSTASNAPETEVSELPIAQPSDSAAELPVLMDEAPVEVVATSNERLVVVTTDVFEVTIDTLGGDIVEVRLLEHLTAMPEDGGEPFTLLNRSRDSQYVAQSGLIGQNGTDTAEGRPQFAIAQSSYSMGETDETLYVDLTLDQNGVKIVKRFEFVSGDYSIGVHYLINNLSYDPWQANFYGQIKRDSQEPLIESSGGVMPYLGAALREVDQNFAKYDFDDMEDESVKVSINGG